MNIRKLLVCFVLPTLVFASVLTAIGVLTINASNLGAAMLGGLFSLVYFGLQYPVLRAILVHHHRTGVNASFLSFVWEPIAFVATAALIAWVAGPTVEVVSIFKLFLAAAAYKVVEHLAIILLR